jgi:hypothetical protein
LILIRSRALNVNGGLAIARILRGCPAEPVVGVRVQEVMTKALQIAGYGRKRESSETHD